MYLGDFKRPPLFQLAAGIAAAGIADGIVDGSVVGIGVGIVVWIADGIAAGVVAGIVDGSFAGIAGRGLLLKLLLGLLTLHHFALYIFLQQNL